MTPNDMEALLPPGNSATLNSHLNALNYLSRRPAINCVGGASFNVIHTSNKVTDNCSENSHRGCEGFATG
jgi:hypothetical protein